MRVNRTAMRIEITRRSDGASTLRCTRADGSVTWQVQPARHAAFFALHDLTHYAVETELGFRNGFYGLIARGWDIDETTGEGKRGALPPEALLVERIVGALDGERAGPGPWGVAEFCEILTDAAARTGADVPTLTEAVLARIRALVTELGARWMALAPGESLVLMFEVEAAPAA